jgi:hypothetical protein
MNASANPVFLTAEWRDLVMLNYAVDPTILAPHVPDGTEVDAWRGTTFVSLVAFSFLDTRVKGVAVPFHRNFEEINLRFYVRAKGPEGWRRGVVFVREVVPRRAIAAVARRLYNENYTACPTRCRRGTRAGTETLEYGWRSNGEWLSIGAAFSGRPALPAEGSEEEFITEHYWGYSSQRDGGTVEYRVEHPRWNVWTASGHTAVGDFERFYGAEFGEALAASPSSAFVADGSAVVVRRGACLRRAG